MPIIQQLKENESDRKQMGMNARDAFEKNFSTLKVADKYLKLIDDLYLQEKEKMS